MLVVAVVKTQHLVLLIAFFEVDMANVFISGEGGPDANLKGKHVESLDIDFIRKISPLQIELIVDLLSSIKQNNLVHKEANSKS